ncbi:hypothetical protein [Leptolyngbya ohadii]|uniref:hypothetical protein n=1 Tax=Leptolyngbya ohadii TaxID=1962290 RepID=UPI00117BACB1|nr:hypothetical protein [Leptolyngbya ohadii]
MLQEDDLICYLICSKCGCQLDWARCRNCGGEGYIDVYDSCRNRPFKRCDDCNGLGGWFECPDFPHRTLTEAVMGGDRA